MPAPTNGEPLSVQGALRTLTKFEGLEASLYHRTEGITSMLWGFVTAGIFFTYFGLDIQYPGASAIWGPLAWIPWVGAGMTATAVLWHSVHVTAKTNFPPREGAKEGLLYLGVFTILFFAVFTSINVAWRDNELPLGYAGTALAVLGTASILLGVLRRRTASGLTRRVQLVSGIVMIAAATLLSVLPHGAGLNAEWTETLVGALVAGGSWFLGGLFLVAKG